MIKRVGAYDVIPEDDLQMRIKGLKRLMAEGGIDFSVIVENVDKFYFTGTMQPGMFVVPTEGTLYSSLRKAPNGRGRRRRSPLRP